MKEIIALIGVAIFCRVFVELIDWSEQKFYENEL